MNLLDRYIFKSILVTCLGAVALFAFVLTVGNVMKEFIGYLLADQIDLLLFLRLTGKIVLFTVSFALPMGVLTGVLLTLGRLSADSEITAMRASGISLLRIARPVILLGLLLSAFTLYMNEEISPVARASSRRELAEAVRANPLSLLVPRTFIRQFPGFVVYVGEKKGKQINDLWLWQLDREQRVLHMIHARSGLIDYNEEENCLVLTLRDAVVEERNEKAPESSAEPQWVGSVGSTDQIKLSLARLFEKNSGTRTKLDFLAHSELVAMRDQLERPVPKETEENRLQRERSWAKVQIVLSERINNALAVLSFALIAVPLGIKVSRRETSANLGVAVALALAYFFCSTLIGWLEKHPATMPWLLLYVPNVVMILLAGWLYARVEKR